ncbi:hypothetical protein BWQ96_02878 [Gracilariopsis chorda]|uniref:Uncharacterized protein n=1 Tax=Gracilariopsis chorda TaxID=448386 RepID=A0A2V3IZ22_9FLOR|nr:hypothetical protein BWQ96_02878 [Gracilariopsis chorda]|eukprot:PXF47398.1 hypothetical protein BWQ96_02878 [Gracilariopsis chorda]
MTPVSKLIEPLPYRPNTTYTITFLFDNMSRFALCTYRCRSSSLRREGRLKKYGTQKTSPTRHRSPVTSHDRISEGIAKLKLSPSAHELPSKNSTRMLTALAVLREELKALGLAVDCVKLAEYD